MMRLPIAVPFLAAACGPRVVTFNQMVPADVRMKLSRALRIRIAGFHVAKNHKIDLNAEAVHCDWMRAIAAGAFAALDEKRET